jgi:hypothetical protein
MPTMVAEEIEGLMHRYSPAHTNVCAVRRDGELRWIARDLYEALGILDRAELAEFKEQPGHSARTVDHWQEASAYPLEVLAPHLLAIAPDRDAAERLVAWMEYREGARRHDPIKRVWEMADAAKLLDGDPNITTGFYELRGWMHRATWLDFDGVHYRPSALAEENGLLTVRKDRIPNRDELYPTVLVTERGLSALHQMLGGVGRLDVNPHQPLLPGMAAHQ